MMMSEFVERTGFEPSAEEYAEIEKAYCDYNGDKDAFCVNWLETVGAEGMLKVRGTEIERLRSELMETEKALRETIKLRETRIKALERQLEWEEEWKPYEDERNVKQADYDELAGAGGTRELSDDEAADKVSEEFGFDRKRIVIEHEADRLKINRHRCVRTAGKAERKALFNAWDWYYIRFSVQGTGCSYEMTCGQLLQLRS